MPRIDLGLFHLLFSFAHRSFLFDEVIVFFAHYFSALLVVFFLYLVLRQRVLAQRLLLLVEGTLAVIIARGILAELISFFYPVARPAVALALDPLFSVSSASFPSGHASFFFALATVLFFHDRFWGSWFFAAALLNAVCRVVSGVHWPLDILGGAAIGVVASIFVRFIARGYIAKIAQPPAGAESALDEPML